MTRRAQATEQEQVLAILEMLDQRAADRQEELGQYSAAPTQDDDDSCSPYPVFDRFYNHRGADAVRTMTNFSPREFGTLWATLSNHMARHWDVGRGKRSQFAAKDVFFMLLLVLKNGGMWDMPARAFNIPTPTFIQTTTKFLRVAAPRMYDEHVAARALDENMRHFAKSGRTFRNFCARCNSGEENPYYSGKHHLHGLKVEVSVSPRSFAINCSDHARGSVADIQLFRRNIEFHQQMCVKTQQNENLDDTGPLLTEYPAEWALLADKEYQALAQQLRVIHPKKAAPGRRLTSDEERENDRISSDRVIADNYFGRLCSLWRICADKYRWSHDLYDDIFQACASLTNFHISHNPLCETDGERFHRAQNCLISIGTDTERRRRFTQENYRRRKRRRSQIGLDDLPGQE